MLLLNLIPALVIIGAMIWGFRLAGRWAKIVTSEPVERQTAFNGRVKGIEGDDVLFESEGKKLIKLPLRLISRARLEVEF